MDKGRSLQSGKKKFQKCQSAPTVQKATVGSTHHWIMEGEQLN